ncbi:MAG: ATP-dependent DNA helicase RecQ, partial [Rikenellaceae bacterium]
MLEEILNKYWGFTTFRPLQKEIIESVCSGKDTLALMPTGGGKSITYQVSALSMEGLCVVVTPLISLMKDQIDALHKKKIAALSIHSGMTQREIDIVLDNCVYGDYKFLYISPERISSPTFQHRFARMNISMIAVDEAHCISQWGYDFRPSYINIAELRRLQPDAPILAVTATATPIVVSDICQKLLFEKENVIKMSFERKNLSYIKREVEDKREHILKVINNIEGCGIVYVRYREDTESIAAFLNGEGISAESYNGGMSYQMRSDKQEKFMKGSCRIMVATNAFGMGIDKADVRFVVHYSPSDSLESYYQEAGRAGRDGKPAFAVLLYNKRDIQSIKATLKAQFPPIN